MFGFNPLYSAVLGLSGGPSPALSLDFMAGALSPALSFSRATNATMFDSIGSLVWAPAQLFSASNDLTVDSRWAAAGAVPGSVASGYSAPDGTLTAFLIDVSGSGDSRVSNDIGANKTPAGGEVVYSAWMRTAPGDPDGTWAVRVRKRDGVAFNTTVALTSTWQRVDVSVDIGIGASSIVVWIGNNGFGGTLTQALIWRPMLGPGTTVWPYIENTDVTNVIAVYGPRFDYNPATLAARGLLIEAQRTNSVPNSALVGGVAGTPGTAPSGWSITSVAGIAISTSYGSENGIPYIDVSYSGTNTSGASAFPTIFLGLTASSAPAASGQTWTGSAYARKVGGTDGIGTWSMAVRARASGTLVSGQSASVPLSEAASLSSNRHRATVTITDPTITTAEFIINRNLPAGASLDITIRIGGSQLEQGGFASSLIPTYGTTATRAGDVADLISDAPWNPAGMTYCAQFERQGNPINSTAEATSALFYFGDASTYVNGVFGFGSSSQARCDMADAGVTQSQVSVTPQLCVPFQVYKWATRVAPNDAKMYANGVAGTPDVTVTMPATIPSMRRSIGRSNAASVQQMHGWLRRLQVYTQALTDDQLQALTA